MTKRRLLRWSLLLVLLATFAVWLEPTRVAWGWLRGEAFYQGRPTSWWAGQLNSWDCWCTGHGAEGISIYQDYVCFPKPNRWDKWISHFFNVPERQWPAVLTGNSDAVDVLNELFQYSDPYVPRWAQEGLERIKMPHATPRFTLWHDMRQSPSRLAPGYRSDGGLFSSPTRIDGKLSP